MRHDERRKSFRVEWNTAAHIYTSARAPARLCIISNLSNGGARITGIAPDTLPDTFLLRIFPRASRTKQCRVLWRSKDALGVQFAEEPNVNPTGRRPSKQRQLA